MESTTFTRRRVVEKVSRRRSRPLWFWFLPVIPAVVAAIGFNGESVRVTATSEDSRPPDEVGLVDTGTSSVPEPNAAASEAGAETPPPNVPADTTTGSVGRTDASVLSVVKAVPDLRVFSAALDAAALGPSLDDAGGFVLFAPTDDAFADLPAEAVTLLLAPSNRARLQQLLRYHVVLAPGSPAGTNWLEDVTLQGGAATTMNGATLTVQGSPTVTGVADSSGAARLHGPATAAGNGFVYRIDRVLLPPGFVIDTQP